MVTQEILKEQLIYNSETGIFTFNKNKGGMSIGSVAGYVQKDGYVAISINGVQYKAHRLAWLYIHGAFPIEHLDHINLKKDDNRITNLRPATRSQNHMNRRVYSNNKLGLKGVHVSGKKYRALIKKDGRQICLGLYRTPEEASKVFQEAAKSMHGEYSRLA